MKCGRLGLCAILAMGALTLVLMQTPSRAEPTELSARLENVLRGTDYKSLNKVSDSVWTVDFNGRHLAKFKVVVTLIENNGSGIIVASTSPVTKKELPKGSSNFTTALLKANNDFDYVKIGIDADGDVFVRGDMSTAVDSVYMKSIIEQVAAATDELYGKIKPMLKTSNT